MKGALGIAVNAYACAYLIVVVFFSFWPTTKSVDASDMNYAVLITGAVVIVSLVYYWLWARKVYSGPVMEIEGRGVVEVGREVRRE